MDVARPTRAGLRTKGLGPRMISSKAGKGEPRFTRPEVDAVLSGRARLRSEELLPGSPRSRAEGAGPKRARLREGGGLPGCACSSAGEELPDLL